MPRALTHSYASVHMKTHRFIQELACPVRPSLLNPHTPVVPSAHSAQQVCDTAGLGGSVAG